MVTDHQWLFPRVGVVLGGSSYRHHDYPGAHLSCGNGGIVDQGY